MKLKDLCIATAAVWPIFSVAAWKVLCVLNGAADGNAGRTPGMYAASAAIGGIACCIVAAEAYVPEPETYDRKKKFSTPTPPQVLMHKAPGGIIFGKYHGKYVETSDRIAHYLIIGQSGSGKSVLLISTLLTNFLGLKADGHGGKSRALFVLDLKGELSWKTSFYDGGSDRDKAPKILSIQKRSLSGYDMFYKLHRVKPATMQEIVETVSQIVNYLIPKPADVKDPFFINAGRNLICGLMIGSIREKMQEGQKIEFIDLMDEILGSPVEEQIRHYLDSAKPESPEYRYLIQFSGQAQQSGNITLASVYSEACNSLTLFANDQNVRYFLKNNAVRATPDDLYRYHRSVYLTMDESKLEQYSQITRIILAEFLDAAFEQPDASAADPNAAGYLFVLDETPRVMNGSRDMARLLTNAVKTLRSKNVIMLVISQTLSAFQESMGSKSIVDDFVSNFEYTVVLSAKDTATAKWIGDLSGKFLQRQVSQSGSYASRKSTTSYQRQELITPDELLTLQAEGKELLICPYGVFRLDKAKYYRDAVLSEASEKCQKKNAEFEGREEEKV